MRVTFMMLLMVTMFPRRMLLLIICLLALRMRIISNVKSFLTLQLFAPSQRVYYLMYVNMKQNINTIRRLTLSRAVQREDVDVVPTPEVIIDIPLMRQVVNDMEYNVGSRPTLPSCFDDSSELGVVDSFADIRVSNWDRLAQECSYSRVKQESTEIEKQPNTDPEPAPTE